MDHSRLNYKVFKWSEILANRQCKHWSFKVVTKLEEVNLVGQAETPSRKYAYFTRRLIKGVKL